MMDLSFVHDIITMLQLHHPWIVDKGGAALVTQSVRELWEQIKGRLGTSSAEKIEANPEDSSQWEVFKSKLIEALDKDAEFRGKIQALARTAQESISQTATGDDNRQAAVSNSQNVNISIN